MSENNTKRIKNVYDTSKNMTFDVKLIEGFNSILRDETRFSSYLEDYLTPDGAWDFDRILEDLGVKSALMKELQENIPLINDEVYVPEPAMVPVILPALECDRSLKPKKILEYLEENGVSVRKRAAIFVVQIGEGSEALYYRMDGKHRCVMTAATRRDVWVPALIFKVSDLEEAYLLYEKINKSGRHNLTNEEAFYSLWLAHDLGALKIESDLEEVKLKIDIKGKGTSIGYQEGLSTTVGTLRELRKYGDAVKTAVSILSKNYPYNDKIENFAVRGMSKFIRTYGLDGHPTQDLSSSEKGKQRVLDKNTCDALLESLSDFVYAKRTSGEPMSYFNFSISRSHTGLDRTVALGLCESFRNYLSVNYGNSRSLKQRIPTKWLEPKENNPPQSVSVANTDTMK